MESLQDLFTSLLNIAICLSPLVLLALATGAVVLVTSQRKRQRAERLRAAVSEISSFSHSGIDSVAQAAGGDTCALAIALADGARLLGQLSNGEIAPLEQHGIRGVVQRLQAYRQRAASGTLPEGELTQERQAELVRTERLVGVLTAIEQHAEQGNAREVAGRFREADKLMADAFSGHVEFHERLGAAGIEFPMAPPRPVQSALPAPSADEVTALVMQKLPQEKQMLFLMQYNGARKNPTTAVLLAIFLGGLGVHRFYMGEVGWGVLYLLFSWTWIPLIVALVEAFFIPGRVHRYNAKKAAEIANTMMLMSG